MTAIDPPRAACLTPPAIGGVAVVQVVGAGAAALVSPLLRSRRPLELAGLDPGELRLCRFVDGPEVVDDVLVAVRQPPNGQQVVDLNFHGGPRIVQRVLLCLKRAGAVIVPPADLLEHTWPTASLLAGEVLAALPRARTRAAAEWLIAMQHELPAVIEAIVQDISTGALAQAAAALRDLLAAADRTRFILEGLRVVLVGPVNAGKSTLANTLTEREHALVSELPGTTRDYVEHPAAADGLPLVIVDTAGLRPTTDELEREAIRRTLRQIGRADALLHVVDASSAPVRGASLQPVSFYRPETGAPELLVLNKCDLGWPAGPSSAPDSPPVCISALTGEGLPELRTRLLDAVGLAGWQRIRAPFTERQLGLCRAAVTALESPDPARAAHLLARFTGGTGQI